jgi:2-amino-4-hydroxy-6-hydroxymethyldihydropteridine diphosphokinase
MKSEERLHRVYLSLGSNLGRRRSLIRRAIELLSVRVGTVVRQSSLIETEPWGFESTHKFLNGAVLCETTLTPREVLTTTQQIERELGRKKPIGGQSPSATRRTNGTFPSNGEGRQYHDRPIDIDILLYDDLHVDEPDLKIPHPLMYEREFVMQPLNEIREDN